MTYDPFDESPRDRHDPRGRHGRKERVLHTRISEQLADDIRRLAEDLRVPVSNLVRNVLEEAVSVVEAVTDDMGDVIEDVVGEAEAARDRIRRRLAERRRRARASGRSYGARRRHESEDDIETELRRDEAAESGASRFSGSSGSGDSSGEPLAQRARKDAFQEPGRGVSFDDIIGWQPLVLNRSQPCGQCSKLLKRGDEVFAGVTSAGLSTTVVCPSWVREERCA